MRCKSRCEVSGRNILSSILCAAGLLSVWFVAPVLAEEKEPEQKVVLEDQFYATFEAQELIVTAQKQEEELKDVPVSVTVMTGYDIEDKHIDGLWSMSDHIPGLIIYDVGMSDFFAAPSMRGITAPANTFTTSVGLYIDGVPILSSPGYTSPLLDIERIEVLRGPQGTLYGKNTEAGVISIVTRQPDNEWRGKISVEAGEDNKRLVMGLVSGPLVQDKLCFSLAGQFDSKDGFIKNAYLGGYDNDRERYFGRGQLRWTPTPDWDISLMWSRYAADEGGETYTAGEAIYSMLGLPAPPPRTTSCDLRPRKEYYNDIQALKIAYDLNESTSITSITTRKMTDAYNVGDHDFTPMHLEHGYMDSEYSNMTQEVRLNWQSDRMKGLFGVYADTHLNDHVVAYTAPDNSSTDVTNREMSGDSYALFGQVDYGLTEAFHLIGGLRYEKQNMDLEDNMLLWDEDKSWDKLTPKLTLQYRFTPQTNVYATVSEGFRTGGFNYSTTDPQYISFEPEELWNYEIGAKISLFDDRLFVRASLYYMEIQDMQVDQAESAMIQYITNAAEATSKGGEIELTARPVKGLSVTAGLGINDTTYDTFQDTMGDYSGNKAAYAPEYTVNLGISYRHRNGLFVAADMVGYGDMYIDKANENKVGAYELVNTKVGYEFDGLDVYLYADNLFDTEYNYINYAGYYNIYSPPREIGLQLAYRF